MIPPQVRVIRTVRPRYACHDCEGSGDESHPAIRIAPMPPAIIDKEIATAGLLAYTVASKFCDSLPLYRQEKQFVRIGVELSRRTMADWMIAASVACAPLMKALERRLRSGPLQQLDETTVAVMDEPDRDNTSLSYVWVARGGAPEAPVILYHDAPSREPEAARQTLGDFEGFLRTDGYEVYDRLCEGSTAVETASLSGAPGDNSGHQRLRECHSAFRGGAQELAVLRQPPRGWGQCEPLQHHRDRKGQPAGAVLVPAGALREVSPCPHRGRHPGPGVLPHHHRLIRSGGVQRVLTLAAVELRRSTAGTR